MIPPVEMFDFPCLAGISLRVAGDMGPSGNPKVPARQSLLRGLLHDLRSAHRVTDMPLLVLRQTHSRHVHRVDSSWSRRGYLPAADGMITGDPSIFMGVTVADCLPIFLSDPIAGVRGIVHSGWRGTGIAALAVRRMCDELDARPERVEALIGPGICGGCYQVDETRYRWFLRNWGGSCGRSTPEGHYVDLAEANRVLLRRAGVSRIHQVPGCTREDERYSSYRRDGNRFVRMLAFCGPAV